MKVLVCGGRNFRSPAQVFRALDRLHQEKPITELMQGGATGADQFAMEWAATKPEIKRYVCHADWETHGRAAGPIRNEKMLTWKPDLVVAFPGGDGTSASGFHPTRSEVLFASFQSNNFFTNFRNGDLTRWVRTADPIVQAGELQSVTSTSGRQFLTFDFVRPDTQFTAFQHVWRTLNNGGNQATLESKCTGGANFGSCGDWVPLGVDYPFVSGTTADSESRKPGDLTSDYYGIDRVGGLIVAAERTRVDSGTLWAATNFGRLFISKNADAPGASVQFVRIDSPITPSKGGCGKRRWSISGKPGRRRSRGRRPRMPGSGSSRRLSSWRGCRRPRPHWRRTSKSVSSCGIYFSYSVKFAGDWSTCARPRPSPSG
jgi:hypothetical protein